MTTQTGEMLKLEEEGYHLQDSNLVDLARSQMLVFNTITLLEVKFKDETNVV
jgi:hypothetical protein